MNEEMIVGLATVYGEAANQSEAAWKAVATTIVNRFKFQEWRKYKTLHELIANSGFDAFTQRNIPYQRAYDYFSKERLVNTNKRMERFYEVVYPIFDKCISQGLLYKYAGGERYVMYYSPKAQAYLHQKNPKMYKSDKPYWAKMPDRLVEVKIPGCENDDFAFYRYV